MQLSPLLLTLLVASSAAAGTAVRVAVVNDIPGHFEVLAGVLETLRRLHLGADVYYVGHPAAPWTLGLVDWLQPADAAATAPAGAGDDAGVQWHSLQQRNGTSVPQAQLLICVSAELAPQVCQGMVSLIRPKLLLLWVHRADTATAHSKILSLHSNYALLALAPHVATLAATRLKQPVGWALPVAPYQRPGPPCRSRSCLHGFAIQGTLRKFRTKQLSGFTRSYFDLWARLAALRPAAGASGGSAGASTGRGAVQVVVVGKGKREDLLIPPALEADVTFYSRLPYPAFWGNISSAYALVPAFGMASYTFSRISSTLLASLVCGVPVIADRTMLDAYSFLTEEHVFLRQEGEDEAAAMYRIMHDLPEVHLFSRRDALQRLRVAMGNRIDGIFRELLASVV